jgi:hypothetical protein
VRNATGADASLFVEPWGMPYDFLKTVTLELVIEGPAADAYVEFEADDNALVAWAWGGSTAEVRCEGQTIGRLDNPVPGLPPGVTAGQVLGTFGLAARRDRTVAGFEIQQTWEDV